MPEDLEFQRLNGLWFAVTFTDLPRQSGDTHVFDVIKQCSFPVGQRYAVGKRQLSARELKEHGLSNETRREREVLPQRHKRKRRKT